MQRPEPTITLEIEADSLPSVVFCITELDPGGAEKALVRFAKGIHEAGWPVHVVSLRDSGVLGGDLESAGITVTALNCGGLGDLRAVTRLTRLLNQWRPDIVVCFLHQANIVGRVAGRLAGVRQVVSGIRVADRRWFVTWSDWLTQRFTSHYFAVSRHVAELHSRLCGIPESKFSVLYNGVEVPDSPANAASRSDGQFRILFVGRLARQKRPQDLVQAVTQLPAELLQRTCVDILGAGELELELRNAIAASGLEDRVHLHGYQSDVEPWWATADLLVLPSAWEGLPNVVLEAMTHRVPVIAASVDGVREVIEHDETGWLVESGNVAGLTAAIVRAELSLEDRNQVAVRAFESVCQRFCWQKSIEAFACRLSELHHDHVRPEKH